MCILESLEEYWLLFDEQATSKVKMSELPDMEAHTHLMEYEKQIFLDTYHDDGLLVMARGLGIERIFTSYLKLYSDPGNLVLVVNANNREEDYFLEKLQTEECEPMPKVCTVINNRK